MNMLNNSIVVQFKKIMKRDCLDDIKNFYIDINPVYRRSFWILFALINIVFSFYTINFFWGNHDWMSLITGRKLSAGVYEGRYGAFLISGLLTDNLYLPIISTFWAFIALSLSSILLAIYWKIPQRISHFVIFGLILNITPYTVSWMWYAHWTVGIFWARVFIFASFILSDKFLNGTRTQKIWSNILAVLLLNISISTYQPLISTIIMVFIGRVLIDMLEWKSLKSGVIGTLKSKRYILLNSASAIIIYKIVFEYFKHIGRIQIDRYNIQTVSFNELLPQMVSCIKNTWQQFTNFSTSFYPDILTKLFLVLAIVVILQILVMKKSYTLKVSIILTLFFSLFLTKFAVFMSSSMRYVMFATRMDFCGYVIFNSLIIALALKIKGFSQNLKILLSITIIYLFMVNDLNAQRVLKFATDTEQMMLNRIQARLENQLNFNLKNKYFILQLGRNFAVREKFYPVKNTFASEELLTHSLTPNWQPLVSSAFYNPEYIKKMLGSSNFTNSEFMSALKRLDEAGLLENAKAWPAENSIIVYEDIILFITDEKDLLKAKQLLAEQNKKIKL